MDILEILAWIFKWGGRALGGLLVLIIWQVLALVTYDEIKRLISDFRNPQDY